MANVLTCSSSYKAILDTTSTVANQQYIETAADQVVGSNSGLITTTYDHDLVSLCKGTIATIALMLPTTASSFWKAGFTLTGSEPVVSDDIRVLFVKAGKVIGQDNHVEIKCGATSMAELLTGEAIQLLLFCPFSEITVGAKRYVAGVDEIQCTVALVGS